MKYTLTFVSLVPFVVKVSTRHFKDQDQTLRTAYVVIYGSFSIEPLMHLLKMITKPCHLKT